MSDEKQYEDASVEVQEERNRVDDVSDVGVKEEDSKCAAPPPPTSLKKNAVYNLISKLLTLLIPLITTPYLARVLGEEGNGQISYVSSIITYFGLIASLGFSVYGQREIAKYRNDKNAKSKVFWEIFIMKLLCTIVSLSILLILIFTVGFGERYNQLMLIMSLQVVAVLFDIEYLYMGEENFKSIALRNIIVRAIGVILIFIFVKTENDVWVYTLYLSLSAIMSYFIMWVGLARHVSLISLRTLKPWHHLKSALIIFLPIVITSLFTTFDKTMIGLLSVNPDYNNGCYEQAYKINSVAQTVVTVFSSVMMSRNAADYKSGNIEVMNDHISKSARYVWLTSLFLIAGFITLSDNFSSWFLGEGYIEVPLLLQIMSIRLLVSGFSVIFGDRFIAMGKEKWWLISVTVGAVANIGINYWLIPIYGAIGAAVATAVCEVMILVAMSVLTFRSKGLPWKPIVLPCWKYLIAASGMFGIMFLMQFFLPNAVWTFLIIGAAGTVIYISVLFLLRDAFFVGLLKSFFSKLKIRQKEGRNGKDS